MPDENMLDKKAERAPQVACYLCGVTDIYSVCHHCAKPMCERHSLAREPGTPGNVASDEYGGMRLERAHAAVYHCKEHDHRVKKPVRLVVIGAVVFAVGLLVAFIAALPGILILLAGAAVGAYGIIKLREYRDALAASAPALPLFPHMRAARVVEHLSGRVDLTERGYRSPPGETTGTVIFSMTHSDWLDRLEKYREKYKMADNAPVSFNAGFALLQGPAGLTFDAGQSLVLDAGTGVWFRGEAEDHDLFTAAEGRHEGAWTPTVSYQLQKGRKPATIPLWIVPSLVPSSDQRALEIDLHWTPLLDRDGPAIELFDCIKLSVPAEWGHMESADPGNATTTEPAPGERFREIEWRQLPPVETDQYRQLQQRKSRSLKIRFEKQITPNSALSGRIEATFEKTLSGVTGVALYLPGGGQAERRQQLVPSAKTKVTVDFTVSLSAIRYQDDRVVPDENNAADVNRSRLAEFAGVVPNSGVIIKLTNAISADNEYYVKSVVEHTPFRDDSSADELNRVWDIAGRFYTGVFPIDFDINVSGKEFQGASGVAAGKTEVRVTVKGSYATGGNADGKLKDSIENRWDHLHRKVIQVFSEAAAQAYAGWAQGDALGQPTAITAEIIEPAAIERGEPVTPVAIGTAEIVEAVIVSPPSVNGDARGNADRKADLLRQWQVADEAVMTGRIADDVYRSMITRIKTELRSLGEDLGE